MKAEYQLICSSRKTVAIQIKPDGTVLVRAPGQCSREFVEEFVKEKTRWILQKQNEIKKRKKQLERQQKELPVLSEADRRKYQQEARQEIVRKTAQYAALMQVDYGRITIRDQKTRWGSCSTKGNLNFNWRLILAPEEILDYVVVHELAHRKEMNHSERFWREVERVLPDYNERCRWLKKHGEVLMQR